MHARQPVPEGLFRLAAEQSGVIDREQALGHGFSDAGIRRLLDQQVWLRLTRGVYLTAALDPTPWFALAWAGVLIGGDRARLGGTAAGHLHGLIPDPPARLEIFVPAAGAVPRLSGPWDFRRERAGARLPANGGRTSATDHRGHRAGPGRRPGLQCPFRRALDHARRADPPHHATAHPARRRSPESTAQPRTAQLAAARRACRCAESTGAGLSARRRAGAQPPDRAPPAVSAPAPRSMSGTTNTACWSSSTVG